MQTNSDAERQRRWRLVLGEGVPPEHPSDGLDMELNAVDREIDDVLRAVYDSDRKGGLGSSSPKVNRWLSDIRRFFPTSVVKVVQRDALERLKLHQMLLQPELLEAVEPDVHLVGTLLSLKSLIPEKTKETARKVVRKVVEEIERRIRQPLASAVQGAIDQVTRTSRPRPQEIDWNLTIRKNLKNYLPEQRTIVPERLVGHGRKRSSLRDVILCVDQSGSMASSVVYSSIFAAVLASLRSVRTRFVVFDTEVVDLSEHLHDPVDLLFGAQLGGGTDIHRALTYCQQQVQRPQQTILVLISDLYEGGNVEQTVRRTAEMMAAGVQVICLLALSDDGAPSYNESLAATLAELGVPSFACTPDLFPDLIAAAIRKQDITRWAASNNVVVRASGQSAET
ncbi:VWA domain-containing protein [Planctomicrobium piriforme]|uniref:VWA domain containing CoxE-like protein n=1 Tax=Planctomicrobium piriforme TaxID=1576369 RepID=A0A1I3FCQ2_9PLAN|nr:VWA domain-containing protein [Planctomicrobium piriforme]SFI08969.1 VWA domain containing CoxE-like protein [Planctomicrobium piriforme]